MQQKNSKMMIPDLSSSIFALIRSICMNSENMTTDLVSIEKRIVARGFALADL
jgi:hypothetical protein